MQSKLCKDVREHNVTNKNAGCCPNLPLTMNYRTNLNGMQFEIRMEFLRVNGGNILVLLLSILFLNVKL